MSGSLGVVKEGVGSSARNVLDLRTARYPHDTIYICSHSQLTRLSSFLGRAAVGDGQDLSPPPPGVPNPRRMGYSTRCLALPSPSPSSLYTRRTPLMDRVIPSPAALSVSTRSSLHLYGVCVPSPPGARGSRSRDRFFPVGIPSTVDREWPAAAGRLQHGASRHC